MEIEIFKTEKRMAEAAAATATKIMSSAIKEKDSITIIAATGASQFAFLDALTSNSMINWSKVTMFHLDEYIGISEEHPASFIKYLKERLISKVHLANYHLIQGDAENPV